jgi:bifunctional isochorismate lyase / aryl carrier protein
MSIAPISPYDLPAPDTWPNNRVSWALEPARAVLLVHDMQNHFVAPFGTGHAALTPVLANIAALVQRAQAAGLPVIYSEQPGGQRPEQRGLLQDFWGSGVPADGRAAGIVDCLAPAEGAWRLTKWRYSAFQKTDLAERLQRAGRDQLLVCGVYAHLGCLLTASEAFMRDVKPFFIGDAVADFSRTHHDWALRYAAERCARLAPTEAVLAWLRPSPAASPFSVAALRSQIAAIMGEPEDDLSETGSLVDHGLDSIRLMTLIERWRQAGASVSFVELAEEPTVAAWSRLLTARLAAEPGARSAV